MGGVLHRSRFLGRSRFSGRSRLPGRPLFGSLAVAAALAVAAGGASAQAVDDAPGAVSAGSPGTVTEGSPGTVTEGASGTVTDATAATQATPSETLPVTRLETEIEIEQRLAAEAYTGAVPLADRLIELTEAEFGATSLEAAEAHQRAGQVRSLAGEHERAEQAFLHAVDIVRNLDGPYTALAIDPLLGLGDSYQSAGNHMNAIAAYSEARTVSRRAYGLLNDGQVEMLDRITSSYQQLNQHADADAQQLQILYLAERSHEEGSPGHLEAIYRYAAWLRATRRFTDERAQYQRAINLIREKHGKEHPLLATPLREIGNSFREQRLPHADGLASLQTALELLDQAAEPLALEKAKVLRDIGDWHIAFARIEPELTYYERAWELLGLVENGDALREEWFASLNNVYSEGISQRGLSTSPAATPGFVIVVFGLDRYGRTIDVQVVQSDPAGFKDEAVLRAVRRWRYRPQIVDGEVVAREGFPLKVNFRYEPEMVEGAFGPPTTSSSGEAGNSGRGDAGREARGDAGGDRGREARSSSSAAAGASGEGTG